MEEYQYAEAKHLKGQITLEPLWDTLQLLDISDEVYFSSLYRDYISNSRMKLINDAEGGTYEKYLVGLGNTGYAPQLELGSAVHCLFLQKDEFFLSNFYKPSGKIAPIIEYAYKHRNDGITFKEALYKGAEYYEYFVGKMNDTKIDNIIEKGGSYYQYLQNQTIIPGQEEIILSDYDAMRCTKCVESLTSNEDITNVLNPFTFFTPVINLNEATILLDIKATYKGKVYILKLKAKLDNCIIDPENGIVYLNDVKTTGKSLDHFPISFSSFHYYRQMAFYLWLLINYVKLNYDFEIKFAYGKMLVVSTQFPFDSTVFNVSKAQYAEGFEEFGLLLRKIVICQHLVEEGTLSKDGRRSGMSLIL